MPDASEPREIRAKAVLRPSRGEKRRNRRRKSRYARPLFSVSHLLTVLLMGLGLGFILALSQVFQPTGTVLGPGRLAGLGLPGAPGGAETPEVGFAQILIWAYLFATPVLFALHRTLFWRGTRAIFRYISYAAMAAWIVLVAILLLSAL